MTRPVCEITGRYLAEQKSPVVRVERRSVGLGPIAGRGAGEPGTNNPWAQLARAVIAQEMAFRGGVR